MCPEGADGMANSVDPDSDCSTRSSWSGSTLFAHNPSVWKLRNITVMIALIKIRHQRKQKKRKNEKKTCLKQTVAFADNEHSPAEMSCIRGEMKKQFYGWDKSAVMDKTKCDIEKIRHDKDTNKDWKSNKNIYKRESCFTKASMNYIVSSLHLSFYFPEMPWRRRNQSPWTFRSCWSRRDRRYTEYSQSLRLSDTHTSHCPVEGI